MTFPFLIHYISQFMTLEPGDLITTGTPAGVGLGMKPPSFLKSGDVVEMEADLLGKTEATLRSRVSEVAGRFYRSIDYVYERLQNTGEEDSFSRLICIKKVRNRNDRIVVQWLSQPRGTLR